MTKRARSLVSAGGYMTTPVTKVDGAKSSSVSIRSASRHYWDERNREHGSVVTRRGNLAVRSSWPLTWSARCFPWSRFGHA
jgi:hypothetical protein